jgi:hypothetical protein
MKSVQNLFNNRLHSIESDQILKLSKNNISIKNVVRGLNVEAFSVYSLNDEFHLFYTSINDKEELFGYVLILEISLKHRNEVLIYFSKYLNKNHSSTNVYSIFNTYQHYMISGLEEMGYHTYNDSLYKYVKNKKFSLAIKNSKGLLYMPFINESSKNDKNLSDNKPLKAKAVKNYIYLMKNLRNDLVKIGYSKNPKIRERTLQSQEPEIELIKKWEAPKTIEKRLHHKYKNRRTRGEWFSLNAAEIKEICIYMNKKDWK